MKKTPAVLTAVFALAFVAVAAVLGVKLKKQLTVDADVARQTAQSASFETQVSEITSLTEQSTGFFSGLFTTSTPDNALTSLTAPSVTAALTESTVTLPAGETSESAAESETSLTEKITTVATTIVNTAFSEAFAMPRVPKYIPSESKVDFNTASLASYKYYPDGDYYYTDDKNAWQKNFGYNQVYDSLAVASWMYYDTVRTTFKYENKDWLIQIWKGQYGYYFVGEEIGVYTKKSGSGNQYVCADKSDWLKMEMCFVWDEYHDGNYKPRFLRPYGEYWWCTGFVIGMESSASMKSREQFRMIAHITFKSTEMAELFANAFAANGFKRVSKLDNNSIDTFVQIGPDVAFVWQNINQHKI
ncbi:MAG: DUF4474 domain-containing protein [Clostridia bacterium]|nr:DUF4474 domain-containing protein [Clostridia bacterium]